MQAAWTRFGPHSGSYWLKVAKMSMNFEYHLLFPLEQTAPMLRTLAQHVKRKEHLSVEFKLPSGERLILPFGIGYGTNQEDLKAGKLPELGYFCFYFLMILDEDEVIREHMEEVEFLKDLLPDEYTWEPDDFSVELMINPYLDVAFDPADRFCSNPNERFAPHLINFEFYAPTHRMSRLFCDSSSVRAKFVRFLEAHEGVCGIFDTEGDIYEVFWLEGRLLDPPVKMTKEQIRERLQASK